MKTIPSHPRILAIAPSSRGFGYAVVEGYDALVDWGVKEIKKDKNAGAVARLKDMIRLHEPEVFVLEDAGAKGSRRHLRIRALAKRMVALARHLDVPVMLFSRAKVRKAYFADGKGTKDALARIILEKYPDDLSSWMPPRRKLWTSEDSRMGIFEAVALALLVRRTTKPPWYVKNRSR